MEQLRQGSIGLLLMRIFGALCASFTVLASSLFAFLLASRFLEVMAFLSPGTTMPALGPVQEGVTSGIAFPVSVAAAVASFILFMSMSFGAPSGGALLLLSVFEKPKELFSRIRESGFSLKGLIIIVVSISFFSALFSTASEYLFFEASLGWLKGVGPISPVLSADYMPPMSSWVLRFVLCFLGNIVYSFVPAFLIYWLLRLLSVRAIYLNLYALSVYASLVPLAFSAASALAGFAAYYAIGRTSPLSMAFLPYIGGLISCGVLAYGTRDVCGTSLKKALIAVLPLIALTLVAIYLKYALIYIVPERIFQMTLQELGVYKI